MSHTTKHLIIWSAIMVVIAVTLISIGHVYGIIEGVVIGYLCTAVALLSIISLANDSTSKQ